MAAMTDNAAKIFLFVAWPLIAMLLLACIGIVLAVAWIAIPFGRVERKGTKFNLKFPWSE